MKLEEVWAKKLNTEIVSELGSGDFGTAYETANGKVIKITTNVQEACCCALTIGEKTRHLVPVHAVQKFPGGKYGIFMDLMEDDFNLDWAFQELDHIRNVTGYTYTEIDLDYLDDFPELESLELSDEARDLLRAIDDYTQQAQRLGFIPEDIKFANSGVDQNGDIRFYDHLYRRYSFDDEFLLRTIKKKAVDTDLEPSVMEIA